MILEQLKADKIKAMKMHDEAAKSALTSVLGAVTNAAIAQGCKDNITRDSLTATYNEYLLKLQELNIVYLGMNMNRYDRYKMLKQSFDILFPNAVPIKDDVDINRIIENKNKLLEEVKEKMRKIA